MSYICFYLIHLLHYIYIYIFCMLFIHTIGCIHTYIYIYYIFIEYITCTKYIIYAEYIECITYEIFHVIYIYYIYIKYRLNITNIVNAMLCVFWHFLWRRFLGGNSEARKFIARGDFATSMLRCPPVLFLVRRKGVTETLGFGFGITKNHH